MLFYGAELMQKICMGKYLKIKVRIINLRLIIRFVKEDFLWGFARQ